jgi:hypothetical protein
MDGAAFDFLEVDAVAREGLEGGKKRSRAVSEAHGDGHFVSIGRRRGGFGGGAEQKKSSEILGVVLNAGGENYASIMLRGTARSDGRASFVSPGDSLAHASRRVFRRNALEVRMLDKKAFALGESHGMRSDGAEAIERGSGTTDEVMCDGQNGLGGDGESAFEERS